MLQRPTFRSTGLPVLLTFIAIVVVNFGLYTRLSSQPAQDQFALPYAEDFASLTANPYEEFGGDWEIRDQRLVQLDTNGFDLTTFIPLTIAQETPYTFESTLQYFGGSMGGGLLFNAQQVTSRQKSHMVRFNVDNDQLWLIYGYFGDDSNFVGQGSTQVETAPNDKTPKRLQLQVDAGTYDIILDGNLVAQDVPLNYTGGSVGFITSSSQVGFDDVQVIAGVAEAIVASDVQLAEVTEEAVPAEAPVTTDAPVTITENLLHNETFESRGTGQPLWRPISGNWTYQDGALIQEQTDLYDLSNIYQNPVTYPMTYEATFRHLQNVGGGLLFNLTLPNDKNNAHMVRYISDANVVAWGYFDDSGAFIGQGSAPVNPPGDAPHTLGVAVADDTYQVLLDGEVLATGLQVVNVASPSYVGLTASQSAVAFDEINIYGGVAPIDQSTTVNVDNTLATGTWQVDGGTITQTDAEATDYVAGTGLAGEQFTVSVDISFLSDLPDIGAGMIFHMSGRDTPAGGYLVRFANGGGSIFWGQYGTDGRFVGEGDASLQSTDDNTKTLTLVVRQSSFDIQVDEQLVAENIPLNSTSGWIGLLSFRGPVEFSNLNILLGEQ